VFNADAVLTEKVDAETGRKISRATYTIYMRRKTLFYTVNLIVPSVLVSSLSMVVFYLPAMAGERITMSVSILLALVVYLQVCLHWLPCIPLFLQP
jgi:nicotinic acetylcholine receptor, invertebrate